MAFYADMQAMVKDLLRPDTEGGLGQVTVILTRTTPGAVDPDRDWETVAPYEVSEQLLAAVGGAEEYADGDTILKTDRRVVAAVPSLVDWTPPAAGESARLSLTIDGRPVAIVRVRSIPPAGTPAAIELIARG